MTEFTVKEVKLVEFPPFLTKCTTNVISRYFFKYLTQLAVNIWTAKRGFNKEQEVSITQNSTSIITSFLVHIKLLQARILDSN